MILLLKGLIIGLTVAMPFGPLGVLCMNYALARGFRLALIAGAGVAVADTLLAMVAGFGLTSIGDWMLTHRLWTHLIGGLFLLYLGSRLYFSQPKSCPFSGQSSSKLCAFLSSFLLTLSNPLTIIVFAALFSSLIDDDPSNDLVHAAFLIFGVFLGSMFWWITLSWGASTFKDRFTNEWHHFIRRIAGAAILAFGLFSLLTCLQ